MLNNFKLVYKLFEEEIFDMNGAFKCSQKD